MMNRVFSKINLGYGQKLVLIATLPLVIAVSLISTIVINQSRQLAEREIAALETQLIEAKKAELRNYVTQARNGFYYIYGSASPDDELAKEKVAQILAAMIYGKEGFFFVYDYDGNNIVSPRQTDMINKNWAGLTDSEGTPIVDEIIRVARSGAGYHSYLWPKPSTGVEAQMITYVTSFPSWRWAVGTGAFVDDVLQTVAEARAALEVRVRKSFMTVITITLGALVLLSMSGLFITIRERRLADAKLKQLTQRIVDAQEEERGRVARELHDSISQILVGVRFALEIARRRLASGDKRAAENLDTGIASLLDAIQEVRRISRDLRPAVLDDLGLGPALKALADEFSKRTGTKVTFESAVFRNRLKQDAKIALYRIGQEALTNIERHANAKNVWITVRAHRSGVTLRVSDDGRGLGKKDKVHMGLGLRNMQERIEQLDGTLKVLSSQGNGHGTTIEAHLPLRHMLPAHTNTLDPEKKSA
jgi:two-component system NarL family sensor kinase